MPKFGVIIEGIKLHEQKYLVVVFT